MAESAAIIGGDGPLGGILVGVITGESAPAGVLQGVIVPDPGLVGVQLARSQPISTVPTTYLANTSQATLRPVT